MDVFDEDLLSFWRCLNDHQVRYIMVGGVALNLHGYHRTTADVDIWLEDLPENRARFRLAFFRYSGQDIPALERLPFIPGWTSLTLKNGLDLDLIPFMKGLEEQSFDDCLAIANWAEVEGVSIPFLNINQLITNKKAINRPKDQSDVFYLNQLRDLPPE
jgi:hypothetical protein